MKRFFPARLPFEAVAAFIAIFVASAVLGATLGTAAMVGRYVTAHRPAPVGTPSPVTPGMIEEGRHLFLQNCAHCHASDATGDEGPNLHRVKKSDERITAIIQNGIKGEMPRFGAKFKDADVGALIAYIRSLK